MSDLCAPIYVVMEGDPEMTFWCFAEVMERMVRNVTAFIYQTFRPVYRRRIFYEIKVA